MRYPTPRRRLQRLDDARHRAPRRNLRGRAVRLRRWLGTGAGRISLAFTALVVFALIAPYIFATPSGSSSAESASEEFRVDVEVSPNDP